MKTRLAIFLIVVATGLQAPAHAQKLAVSTNALDYADFGTLNAEVSYSLSRHWGLTAGVRYNPFMYTSDGHELSARQRAFSAGTRYWPWHVFSGWWFSGKVQYQEYNRGGITSLQTREGDRYGVGAGAGYTYMLTPHLNIEFGLGGWLGLDVFTEYDCPVCGITQASGHRFFILPNDLLIALSYVF